MRSGISSEMEMFHQWNGFGSEGRFASRWRHKFSILLFHHTRGKERQACH
jgi:hypothetical protein